jgi:alkylation response protein AidB-like acyl-CoA dehydrogenase
VLEALLDAGRAVLAAELVGAGDEVFARTLAYLKERKQFGKTIGEFQALQHRAAVLLTDLEMARAAVMKALQAAQAGGTSAARWVSVAKAKACAAGGLAAQEGVQMHGGMGMTDEFDMGLFMKRVRVLQELFGDASFHGDRLARIGGY